MTCIKNCGCELCLIVVTCVKNCGCELGLMVVTCVKKLWLWVRPQSSDMCKKVVVVGWAL